VEYAVAQLFPALRHKPGIQLPMGSLEFLIDCDLAVTQLLTEMSARGISRELKAAVA